MFDDYLLYCDPVVKIIYYFTFISVIGYMIYYSKKRSIFSLENYFIIMSIIVPILLMILFSFSSMNIYASWDFFYYRPLLNNAIKISCFGIFSFLFGATLSRLDIFYKISNPKAIMKGVENFWFGFNNFYIRMLIFIVMVFFIYIYNIDFRSSIRRMSWICNGKSLFKTNF